MKTENRGRPSKYEPKFVDQLYKYFDIEAHFETPVIETRKDGSTKESIKFIPSDLPTKAGFAKSIKISRDTLYEWERVHPEFKEAMAFAEVCQEHILIQNGLKGLYNPIFAVNTAKNVLGWRDKQEITGKDGEAFSFQVISGTGHTPDKKGD